MGTGHPLIIFFFLMVKEKEKRLHHIVDLVFTQIFSRDKKENTW
jgi:hypothetical protein